MYYRLRPLFRALIVVVDYRAVAGLKQIVHLLRTACPSELSAPITFESISPKLELDMFLDDEDSKIIATTLSAAIDFITSLELREQTAFSESQRDSSVMDERGADPGYYMKQAKSMGYTGPDIRTTSSSWIKLAEGEDLLPPLTQVVMRKITAPSMINDPKFARYRRSDQRDKHMLGSLCEALPPLQTL